MAAPLSFINDIVDEKIDWKLKIRVIRLRKIFDSKNHQQLNSIEMVLLDEKGDKIQATIKPNYLERFHDIVQEGLAYAIENVLVNHSNDKLKITNNKYKLSFMRATRVTEVVADKIPVNYFDFVPFSDILNGKDEGHLIDVIGHVVEKDDIKEMAKKGKTFRLLDTVLEDLEHNRIVCTLWDQFADEMSQYLSTVELHSPVVVILQLCKIKTYNGQGGISNAYNGTKLLLNPDLKEVIEYKEKLRKGCLSLTQVNQMATQTTLSISEDLLQTPKMTISEIIQCSEVSFGSLLATIIDIDTDNGWWYQACTNCFTKVKEVGQIFYCENKKCDKLVLAVPRFKIELKVVDESGITTLILFDSVVSKLLGKTAADMIENDSKNMYGNCPYEIQEAFLEKEFVFKVEIKEKNIINGWKTFTAKRISDDKELLDQFKTVHSIKEHLIEDTDQTPLTNTAAKRPANTIDITTTSDEEETTTSSTKYPKIYHIKKEPSD